MQDLTEDTPELDLDAALTRTRARHDELVRARNVRRRWVTGGALAVLLVAAAVIVPQLGSGNGQRVNVAAGGGAAATTSTIDTPGFRMTTDGDVTMLKRFGVPVPTIPVSGEVGVGEAAVAVRPAAIVSVAGGSRPDSVLVGFAGCGFAVESVRYRQAADELVVDAALDTVSCPANETEVTVELPLDSPWVPGTPVRAATL